MLPVPSSLLFYEYILPLFLFNNNNSNKQQNLICFTGRRDLKEYQ